MEHWINEYKPRIRAAFEYPGEGWKLFFLLTLEIYKMTVDLPINLTYFLIFENKQVL